MSFIKIDLKTDEKSGDINIDVKAECSENELEIATGHLMGLLASSTKDGFNTVKELTKDIEEAMEWQSKS